MKQIRMKKIWFVIYVFLAVFQPPLLPIPAIWAVGALTALLLLMKFRGMLPLKILYRSRIYDLYKFFFCMMGYLIIITAVDLCISPVNVTLNRMRCVNQLMVLSLIEFMAVWYIFLLADELGYGLKDVMGTVITVGVMQGVCAVMAYNIPAVRSIFIRFSTSDLFSNAYFFARRGFGFSSVLIDTFGYGMGLIAGYLLLSDWKKDKIKKSIALFLILFAIFVNARTGIIVFGIAVLLKMLQGKHISRQLLKIGIAAPILYILIANIIPFIIDAGMRSSNVTVNWVFTALRELYVTLLYGGSTGDSLTDASFFSNFGNLPTHFFELVFGSGHSIYDTYEQLGFRTDIGYINLIWEFGIAGTVVILGKMFFWMYGAKKRVCDVRYKSMVWLNIIAYFLVLLKAILLGYNPGTMVNYLVIFAMYYYTSDVQTEMEKTDLFERKNENE